jgi:MoxR-like ATPase
VPALGHRIVIRPELWLNNVAPETIVEAVLEHVPVPDAEAA